MVWDITSRSLLALCRVSVCAGFSTLQQLQPGQQAKYTPYLPQVHGVLYQLDKQDLPKLTKKEGGYQLVDIEVCEGFGASSPKSLAAVAAVLTHQLACQLWLQLCMINFVYRPSALTKHDHPSIVTGTAASAGQHHTSRWKCLLQRPWHASSLPSSFVRLRIGSSIAAHLLTCTAAGGDLRWLAGHGQDVCVRPPGTAPG
jgi:hypothetical protein